MTTETTVRIVEATPEHASFIAWVTLTAFRSHLERGFWDVMLDGDEAYKLRYLEALATTEQLHWAHQSTFIIAEVDGKPASALCGYIDEELGGPTLRMAVVEANEKTGRTEEETVAGFERAKSIMPGDPGARAEGVDYRERGDAARVPPQRALRPSDGGDDGARPQARRNGVRH